MTTKKKLEADKLQHSIISLQSVLNNKTDEVMSILLQANILVIIASILAIVGLITAQIDFFFLSLVVYMISKLWLRKTRPLKDELVVLGAQLHSLYETQESKKS